MGKRKAPPVVLEGSDAEPAAKQSRPVEIVEGAEPPFRNKEKVLLLSSRGITYRSRHLMLDLGQLLPHCKRDNKLDTKSDRGVINEVAEIKGCSSVVFFEARKHKDLYLWLARTPDGPSVKFHVVNVHTMAELKLSGNHLKGSRPVLSFHAAFDEQPHLQVIKELLMHVFGTPRRHPKSKPFFDHVISFSVADGCVWLRNYQVVQVTDKGKPALDDTSLVEVGPRCCLNPIKMFEGSFGGPLIYDNPAFVSPNKIRALLKKQKAGKYGSRVEARERRHDYKVKNAVPRDELAHVFD